MSDGTKTRLGSLPPTRYPWYVRLIFALQRRKYGRPLEPALLWGRIPRAFLMLTLLYRSLDRAGSPLDPVIELFDTDGVTSLAFNDDSDGLDSFIRYYIEVTGDYYLAIRGFAGSGGSGQTYTINFNTGQLYPGEPTTSFASGFDLPGGMAFDRQGNLLVADEFKELVVRVDATGMSTVFATGMSGAPLALTFDAFGDLLVASVFSILRQTGRLSEDTEVPCLFILAGVLALVARIRAIPVPKWYLDDEETGT